MRVRGRLCACACVYVRVRTSACVRLCSCAYALACVSARACVGPGFTNINRGDKPTPGNSLQGHI